MGKTRDHFKKIKDTKGTFLAKMGAMKDRNGMDLTETEDIEKRWQEYTEEHWGTRVSFNSGFLSVYAQQWDCWVIWQFYFQYFKESPHCSP